MGYIPKELSVFFNGCRSTEWRFVEWLWAPADIFGTPNCRFETKRMPADLALLISGVERLHRGLVPVLQEVRRGVRRRGLDHPRGARPLPGQEGAPRPVLQAHARRLSGRHTEGRFSSRTRGFNRPNKLSGPASTAKAGSHTCDCAYDRGR